MSKISVVSNVSNVSSELSIQDKLLLITINGKLETNFTSLEDMELYCLEFICGSSKELHDKLNMIISYLKYKKIKLSKDTAEQLKKGEFAEFLASLRYGSVDFSEIIE